MRERQIDHTRHMMTGNQALHQLIACWRESKELPILMISPQGKMTDKVYSIRVALARAKKNAKERIEFGFSTSEVMPCQLKNGDIGEAIVIRWKMSHLQKMMNSMNRSKVDLNSLLN